VRALWLPALKPFHRADTHFAGPTWKAKDGRPDGDRLVNTTYIQRVATTGGLAPAAAD